MILSSKGIVPSDEWTHDVDIEYIRGRSIKSNLEKYNYVYVDG